MGVDVAVAIDVNVDVNVDMALGRTGVEIQYL